jgi:hypothetical protein
VIEATALKSRLATSKRVKGPGSAWIEKSMVLNRRGFLSGCGALLAASVLRDSSVIAQAASNNASKGISTMPMTDNNLPTSTDPNQSLERTTFQTHAPYSPAIDFKSDVAIVYGIEADTAERIAGWKKHGYLIHLMTGVAWGEYQDYLDGRWDGKKHWDESQTDKDGNIIGHGVTVPYIAPSETYGKYLWSGVKKAIDAGAETIYLEEPEFWARAGYSESFRREWQTYYNEPWIAPHISIDAQYRASKLKYYLYRRALQQVFDAISDYNVQTKKNVKCYVASHSLINYANWSIVSPESSLVMLKGCDGYIGQVWTGTARTPNFYAGVEKERSFEVAFLEYGSLYNLVRSG